MKRRSPGKSQTSAGNYARMLDGVARHMDVGSTVSPTNQVKAGVGTTGLPVSRSAFCAYTGRWGEV